MRLLLLPFSVHWLLLSAALWRWTSVQSPYSELILAQTINGISLCTCQTWQSSPPTPTWPWASTQSWSFLMKIRKLRNIQVCVQNQLNWGNRWDIVTVWTRLNQKSKAKFTLLRVNVILVLNIIYSNFPGLPPPRQGVGLPDLRGSYNHAHGALEYNMVSPEFSHTYPEDIRLC